MTITVWIPSPLRPYCDGAPELTLSATSVGAALARLEIEHPALYRNICDETGAVRRHINIFVNHDHIRDREGVDTALSPDDTMLIIPAVSGG
jgi:molybdopterin converting factor small subunit